MKRLTEMYRKAKSQFKAKMPNQKGATMVEYALMVALIAAVCVTVVGNIGTGADNAFDKIAAKLP